MLGGTQLTSILGSGVDGTDHDAVKAFVRTLCNAGVAVLFIQPGTKEPADMRTGVARGNADRAAQAAAREAGRADWERVRAPAGLHLATSDNTIAQRYLKRYVETYSTYSNDDGAGNVVDPFISVPVSVNLAIEVGRSRLVVVDCDTAEQVAEFLAHSGVPLDMPLPPTVKTPGKLVDGEWVHSNGGHFYFTLGEGDELPTEVGSANLGVTRYAVLWHNRYVLIPPSRRAEGVYEVIGRDYPLPQRLRDEIVVRSEQRRERAALRRTETDSLDPVIDAWAAGVSWVDILAPLGWVPISQVDNCGCPMLTAPGDHASPKSATAHEAGCSLGRWDNDVNAPLHIWTDNPGEPFASYIAANHTSTLSKLQAVAMTEFRGDVGAAMTELNLAPEQVTVGERIQIEGVAPIETEPDADPANLDDVATEDAQPPLFSDGGVLPGPTMAQNTSDEPETIEPGFVLPTEIEVTFSETPDTPEVDPDVEIARPTPSAVMEVIREDVEEVGAVLAPPLQIEQMSLAQLAGHVPFEVTNTDADFPAPGPNDTGLYLPTNAGVPEMAPFGYWAELPPPEFIIEGLIEHRGLSCVIGPPGAGKSTVTLDMACHIATGRSWQGRRVLKTRVLYLPGEGLSGVVQRLHAWTAVREADLGDQIILGRSILQLGATKEAWAELREYVARQSIGLIVFDTFARMATGIEENSATDVGKAIKRFDQVRDLTGCGVMVVHHTGKSTPDVARGSSALNGALDSEILVTADRDRIAMENENWARPIHLRTTKQKNAEQDDTEIDLLMVNWQDRAPLITGLNGHIDPMQGEILLARPVPEPLIETAVRIRAFVDRFTEQGVTRTDIAQGVRPDAYTVSLGAGEARAWRLRIAEAVDRSLRWDLLTTLSGTPSGARYIPGVNTAAQARLIAAAEVMDAPDA